MTEQLKHIAIMPDGNGRWAAAKGLPRSAGHTAGYEVAVDMIEECFAQDIDYLSIYTLNKRNFRRKEEEVENIIDILFHFFSHAEDRFVKRNIRLNPIGDFSLLPKHCVEVLKSIRDQSRSNTGMTVNVAVGYSGIDDLLHEFKHTCQEIEAKHITIDDITSDYLLKKSMLAGSPPVDLCIRTGGELRISDFCLVHLAYAEFYFTDILWPDFNKEELQKAIKAYYKRNRRFGLEA